MAAIVATAAGAGLSPVAPGTMGSLVALPIAYFTRHWSWEVRLAFWGFLTLVGTWAAKVFDQLMETRDNQCIVIDEVIGIGITSWTVGDDLKTWCFAFVCFRFFDILKPPPVRQVDRWSKNKSAWSAGFGVIADDMVAGLQGLGLIILLQGLHFLPT
jgi:phosphatidylglycerophosphatase A